MVSSDSNTDIKLRCIQYEIDQRNNKLYNEYLNKKSDYVQCTKDLFHKGESCNKGSVIELGVFEPINYSEKYALNTLQLLDKAQRTGVLHLAERGYTSVPEFVWTFGMPSFERGEIIFEDTGSVHRKSNKYKRHKLDAMPLVYLDLSRNDIRNFVPKAPLEHVELLKLSHCKLESISEKVLLFRNLKVLLLGNNNLRELPSCLGYLDNLEELDVQCNNLAKLPPNLCNIHSLKKVNISENQFISITSYDVAIHNLEEIKASSNLLLHVAEGIQLLGTLKVVDVSNNKLTILPDLCYMPYLQIFYANFNKLIIFPNFAGCKCLHEIQFKSNRIQEIVMENLQSVPVEILLLNDNKIQIVPENINELSNLVSLGLNNNCIKNLPYQLALISTLDHVNIEGNPIEEIGLKSTGNLVGYLMKQYKLLKRDNRKLKIKIKEREEVKNVNINEKEIMVEEKSSSLLPNKKGLKRTEPLLATTLAKELKKNR